MPTYYSCNIFSYSHHASIRKLADKFGLHGKEWSWKLDTMDWEKALDMTDMIFKTVKGSLISPALARWITPYLCGKGVSLENSK